MAFPKSFIQSVSYLLTLSLAHSFATSAYRLPLYKGRVIARPWIPIQAAARLCKYSYSEECTKVAFSHTLGSSSQLKARCPSGGWDGLPLLRTACEKAEVTCKLPRVSLWQKKLRMGRDENRAGTGKRGTWEPTVNRCWGGLSPGSQAGHRSLALWIHCSAWYPGIITLANCWMQVACRHVPCTAFLAAADGTLELGLEIPQIARQAVQTLPCRG